MYEYRRCEVKKIHKIAKDLEDAARRHNSKTLYWLVKKMRGNGQSGLLLVKNWNGTIISKGTEKKSFINMVVVKL